MFGNMGSDLKSFGSDEIEEVSMKLEQECGAEEIDKV